MVSEYKEKYSIALEEIRKLQKKLSIEKQNKEKENKSLLKRAK